jgi:hypothetical protein
MDTASTDLAEEVFVEDVHVIEPLPLRVRIGVTGHRTLPADPLLTERVQEAIQHIQRLVGEVTTAGRFANLRRVWAKRPTPIQLAVVSALAEGADRLVAREVLREPRAVLEAVLPLPRDDYSTDFMTEASKDEFNALLQRASVIWELPQAHKAQTRRMAYEQGGNFVVGRSDVLIALWDGQEARGQGGTAEIVALARQRQLPLFWIDTSEPYTMHVEHADFDDVRPLAELGRQFETYNRTDLNSAKVTDAVHVQTLSLATSADRSGVPPGTVEPFGNWIFPYRAVAARHAHSYRDQFYGFGRGVYVLSALAVVCVALPTVFKQLFPAEAPFVAGEIGCLLLILVLYTLERRVHKRWITYRVLAERFLRSELFIRLVAVGDDRVHSVLRGSVMSDPTLFTREPAEEWLDRFLDEIHHRGPAHPAGREDFLDGLKELLAETWIGGQIAYLKAKQHLHERAERAFTYVSYALFGLAVCVAFLHVLGVQPIGFAPTESILIFFALILPGIFGAINGIQEQGEHLRNAERSRRIWPHLRYVQQRLRTAQDLASLEAVVREAADLLMSENRDWASVMLYREPELHV